MKIKSLKTFHLKALEMLKKSGHQIDEAKVSTRFRLTGNEVSCNVSYDDKILDVFALGETPEICLLDLQVELTKKGYKTKEELNLTL